MSVSHRTSSHLEVVSACFVHQKHAVASEIRSNPRGWMWLSHWPSSHLEVVSACFVYCKCTNTSERALKSRGEMLLSHWTTSHLEVVSSALAYQNRGVTSERALSNECEWEIWLMIWSFPFLHELLLPLSIFHLCYRYHVSVIMLP